MRFPIIPMLFMTMESEDDHTFIRMVYEESYHRMAWKAKEFVFDETIAEDIVQAAFVHFATRLDS